MKDEREQQARALCDSVREADAAAVGEMLLRRPGLANVYVLELCDWGEEYWLALHHAAVVGEVQVARLLLDAGASPDSRTRFRTPMHARESAVLIAVKHGRVDLVRLLLDRNGQFEVRDANHVSALSHAAAIGSEPIIEMLLGRGAMTDPIDDQQRTPLHHAIRGAHTGAAKQLVRAGADVNHLCLKEPTGYTPLHRCVSVGQDMIGVARLLLERGADVQAADPRHGKTARDLAEAAGLEGYLQLL
ncbi:MAG: ankyrin repeat domain-containing protein [Planctomycetota bacterium]